MSDFNNGYKPDGGYTAEKLDRLSGQIYNVETRLQNMQNAVNATAAANQSVIDKITSENEKLKMEVQFVSAQLESVCVTLMKSLKKLTADVEEIKNNGKNMPEVEELASDVASRIIIPENSEMDIDRLAEKIVELNAASGIRIDYETLGLSVARSMYIPSAVVEDLNYDELAAKISANLPESRPVEVGDIDYDMLGVKVATNLVVPHAIAEDIDYETLASEIVAVMPEVKPEIDYDTLGVDVAKNITVPAAVAEPIDYAALASEIVAALPEELKIGTKEEVDYDALAANVAQRIAIPGRTELSEEEMSAMLEEVLRHKDVVVENVTESEAEHFGADSIDYDRLGEEIAKRISVPAAAPQNLNYDELAAMVASIAPQEQISPDYIASKVAEQLVLPETAKVELDADDIAEKVVARLTMPLDDDNIPEDQEDIRARLKGIPDGATPGELNRVAAYVTEQPAEDQSAAAHAMNYEITEASAAAIAAAVTEGVTSKIDTEEIADAIAKRVGSVSPEDFEITVDDDGCDSLAKAIEERLDYDAIAAAVAERMGVSGMTADLSGLDIDAEELATSISEKLTVNTTVNEDALAEKAAAILSNFLPEVDNADIADKVIAGVIPALPSAPTIDGDEIADVVTERMLKNQEESDFDIVIDDEGLSRITDGITEELSRLSEVRNSEVDGEIATIREEYAVRFTKIEEELAAIKQNGGDRLTAIDEKVADLKETAVQRFGNVDGNVDNARDVETEHYGILENSINGLRDGVSERLGTIEESVARSESETVETPDTSETDERIARIEDGITELKETYGERTDRIEGNLSELSSSTDERFSKLDGDVEEIKNMLLAGAVVAAASETAAAEAEEVEEGEEQEELVTVSDVVGDEEPAEEAEEDGVIEDIVEDINESPTEEEVMPDGLEEDGVDFANMMKYNRSFIARIIQGTDEQKEYYGRVKTALLSYKKVNSNIAWGAERFNKGRETIARFKIRGKTLCLYLSLDPNAFEKSVYHQADVSDNKSMKGTPMMVKIKSPLGVKKAIRLIDEMLAQRDGVKRSVPERNYAAMYPYETIEELIDDGLVKDVSKK